MSITRRSFLKRSGAALAMLSLPPGLARAAASPSSLMLNTGTFRQPVVSGAEPTRVWGFNGSVPGPVLRYRRGDRVRVGVVNDLPQETTVHWHGLRVPNPMDGVPHITQLPIAPGGRFDYEFTVQDAGTFWYHPHQSSYEQVPRGLYGAFIVEEDKPIEVDREAIWVLSDFKLGIDNQPEEDFGAIRDFGGGGRIGNIIAINGRDAAAAEPFQVRAGERIRLRLLNCASARSFAVAFAGHRPMVVAYDGHAVTPHEPPGGALLLGPGNRADVVLDCMGSPGSEFTVADRWDGLRPVARIVYTRDKPLRDKPMAAPIALQPNPLPEPDLARATRHFVVFEGGLLGRPAIGKVDGAPRKIYELMEEEGLAWTINYTSSHEHALMHEPFLRLELGEHVILKMINRTEFEHPMHLHGHTFRVLSVDGRPTPHREWRDTVMVAPRGEVEVAFVADNPGEWMYHCHILEHAAGGMLGTIAVGL